MGIGTKAEAFPCILGMAQMAYQGTGGKIGGGGRFPAMMLPKYTTRDRDQQLRILETAYNIPVDR